MSDDLLSRIDQLSPKRLALLALELQEQLDAATRREPLAVIGIGCRFPGGADSPAAFWQLLSEGRDAIRTVPPDRWDADAWFDPDPDAPGRMSVRQGGFLDAVDGFDAAFFGIAPREALTMDPQQRLALEVAWEALEHAGLAPERLAGTPTGVFLGVCNSDHVQRVLDRGVDTIDAYFASGNAHSVAAGRIAYCLGLQGPALAIDTACSSSLVALHAACASLRRGETRVALAGGVNLMLLPQITVALSKAHMLAPDGRCKSFDASADGFARGEGCGFIVLKRLADAQADGDRVLAVIRGSATNQDGRSGGLTVPNGPAQEAVIAAALADAGLAPADVGYVEAHGTGTTLGDPIEVRALGRAYGAGRAADAPLLVGSVKTNLGHLESAAGIAGVIKAVLALHHGALPKQLHFTQPSPHIDWSHPVRVVDRARPWPRGAVPRRAGVSSFGFSGTNAHVVIEEAPAADAAPPRAAPPLCVLPLSARTLPALRQLAQAVATRLAAGDATLDEVAHAAGTGRSHLAERLAVVAADAAQAGEALLAFARGEPHAALHHGRAAGGGVPETVFLFTGQGAQHPGMGERLYALVPAYRAVIDACDAQLGADAQGRRLRDVLRSDAVHETAWTQPALYALEMALVATWKSFGVEPAAVIGHSLGEYAAACAAGVFLLEEGLKLVAERGRLMQALPPGGAMASVYAAPELVERAVATHGRSLAIAARNAPDNVVVSGDAEAVDALLATLASQQIEGKRLHVGLAAHSPRVEPALAPLAAVAARVAMQAPRLPVAWNVTGGPLGADAPDAAYWCRHLRETVRFGDGIAWLHAQGWRQFLEVGPHPTLAALAQRGLPEDGVHLAGSLRRGRDDWHELSTTLADLYVRGAAIDWAGVAGTPAPRRVELPTTPFERQRYWIDATPVRRQAAPPARGANPFAGTRLDTAVPIVETLLAADRPAWLADHRVLGRVLLAGPVFLELAQAAAAACGTARPRIEGFEVQAPLVLDDAGRVLQVHLGEDGRFEVHSRAADGAGAWQRHAVGRFADARGGEAPAAGPRPHDAAVCDEHDGRLRALGITLDGAWRSLRAAQRFDGGARVLVALAPERHADPVALAHPALLDGALQAVGLALPGDGRTLYLLAGIDALQLDTALPPELVATVRLHAAASPEPAEWRADVALHAPDGTPLGRLDGVRLRRAAREALAQALGAAPDAGLAWHVDWERCDPVASAARTLVPPAQWVDAVRARFGALASQHGLGVYDALNRELDALSALHVGRALQALGFDATPGRRFDTAGEAARLGVVPRQQRLFGRLLQMLAEDGVLQARDGGWQCLRAPDTADPAPRDRALETRFTGVDAERAVLRRCGPALAEVLRGTQDPLQLLFPGGSLAEARQLYVESPFARTYNGALAAALSAAIAQRAPGAPLRVLEIGAGTGGSTGYLLPVLPPQDTRYTFTDLSPLFLERAAETFAAYPFVERRRLDIERDPAGQGFEPGRHDVVVAANVLHACADLRAALRHARQLLAPGGLLLLMEGTRPERWVDLSFGLTEGWWRFTDHDLRADHPLVDRAAWLRLLAELGFSEAAALPADGQQALIVARAPRPPRRWTLAGGPGPFAAALAARLAARGDVVARVAAGERDVPAADDWVWLGALEGRGLGAAVNEPLHALAALAARPDGGRAWLVTRGAQPVPGHASPGGPDQLPLWGVGRVFALEHPARWGGAVDLDADGGDAAALDALLATLDSDDGEDQTAWRAGQRRAPRLLAGDAPAERPDAAAPPLSFEGSYLVTGGFGGLGLLVARWLAERGARNIGLLGRHPQAGTPALREIEALGARVVPLAGDVCDAAAVERAVAALEDGGAPLRGVLHLAAHLDAAPITALTDAQVEAMLRPKVSGTQNVIDLARTRRLDFVALFSSTTALLGAAGFAHYAAANLFLDAAAAQARAEGLPVLSIAWGTWATMRVASDADREGFRLAGLDAMDDAAALAALGRLLAAGRAHAVVASVDPPRLRALHEARRARPFLKRLDTAPAAAAPAAAAGANDLLRRLEAAPADLRRDLLVAEVAGHVARVLGLPAGTAVAPATGLFDLGMDSLMAVELKRRLEQAVGRPLPSTLTFNHPNVGALAAFLEGELGLASAPAPSVEPVPPPREDATDDRALDDLSDEELESRLLLRLGQMK